MKLGELCDLVRGSSPRPKSDMRFYGGTVPRLMVADLTRDGKLVSARIDTLTELGAKQSRPMTQGDVVIAVSGAPGLPAILAHDACIHDGFVGLRKLDRKRLNADFLYAYLIFIRATNSGQAVGAIFKNLTSDQIKGIEIPELPLAEQKRIAGILDAADALRAKRRQSLAQLDALLQSTFSNLFGNPVTNSMGWETCLLESIANKITDGTHKTPVYKDSGVEFLSAKDLKGGGIAWGTGKFISASEHCELVKRCNPALGDILLAKSGSLGNVAIVDRLHEFSLFESLCLIKHNREKVEGTFLIGLLRSPSMLSHLLGKNKGVAIKHLHLVDVRNLRIPLPPLPLQRRFAAIVESVERQKARQRAHLAELDALFAALQHRAFRGEL